MAASKLARAYGTIAGLGFIGAALLAVPSTLLLEPRPEGAAYLLTLAGVVTGLMCIAMPWERLSPGWLHLFGVLATVEAAAAVAVFGQAYVALFFLIAVAVAYVAPEPRIVAAHVGLIALALVGPIAYGPEGALSSLQVALVVIPNLVLTATLFAYLRMRLVSDRRSYHRFAQETLALSARIAGRPLGSTEVPLQDSRALALTRRVRLPSRAAGVGAAVLAVPLVAAGVAAAGVALPAFAADSFERVGIELPNQSTGEPAPESELAVPALDDSRERADAKEKNNPDGRQRGSDPDESDRGARGDAPETGSGGGSTPSEGAPPSPAGSPDPAPPPVGVDPRPIRDALDETIGTIEDSIKDKSKGKTGLLP